MVRYSKLPFRELVSLYDCHITTTPMILVSPNAIVSKNYETELFSQAKEFSRSAIARDAEFSTNATERGTFLMQNSISPSLELDHSTESRAKEPDQGRRIRGALMVQFAANDVVQLADAAELVKPWVDGIDLNCGEHSFEHTNWSVSIC